MCQRSLFTSNAEGATERTPESYLVPQEKEWLGKEKRYCDKRDLQSYSTLSATANSSCMTCSFSEVLRGRLGVPSRLAHSLLLLLFDLRLGMLSQRELRESALITLSNDIVECCPS